MEGLTSVFGMGTGATPPAIPPEILIPCESLYYHNHVRIASNILVRNIFDEQGGREVNGQGTRSISTGKLNTLLRLHPQPIDVVVYHGPSEGYYSLGDLILRWASRLDAFSGYPYRTQLPSIATGVTTGTLEVRLSRSSRTKDSPSQVSCAYSR